MCKLSHDKIDSIRRVRKYTATHRAFVFKRPPCRRVHSDIIFTSKYSFQQNKSLNYSEQLFRVNDLVPIRSPNTKKVFHYLPHSVGHVHILYMYIFMKIKTTCSKYSDRENNLNKSYRCYNNIILCVI